VPKLSTITETGSATADGVGELDFSFAGEASGDNVLGDVARHVAGGAVNFGWIFAGKSAAAVAAVTAVGVDDNFAASETGVAHGSADDEAAGWVDVILGVFVEHSHWHDWLDDVFENGVAQIVVGNGFTVLGRNDDGVHADGLAVTIFDRDLGLAVGPEKIDFLDLRISESLKVSWWASWMGIGINSGVSSQAKPNIRPWSPAPPVSTPMAISGDWRLMVHMTAQVSES